MRLLAAVLAIASLLSVPSTASAAADYSYAGSSFERIRDELLPAGSYTTAMRITGSFELASELGPGFAWSTVSEQVLRYAFTDGRNHLTEENSRIVEFLVATDAFGNVNRWSIYIVQDLEAVIGGLAGNIRVSQGPGASFEAGVLIECLELDALGDSCALSGIDAGEVGGLDLVRLVPISAVPEPSSSALLALGLAGMAGVGRRRTGLRFPGEARSP